MKRSIVPLFLAAMSLCVGAFSFAFEAAKRFVLPVYERVKRAAFKVFAGPAKMASNAELVPGVLIVAARAFTVRILKRERPLFTASWRMCPSI